MKIVHIITRLIIGGAQENTLLLCQGQHQRGHEVTLITGPALGPEGSLMDRARSGGYRVIVVDEMRRAVLPIKDWLALRRLTALLQEIQPDIVHTHSSKAGILGRRAARRAGLGAVVHTIHGLAFTASTHPLVNWLYESLERRAAPLTSRIVCVADAMRDQSLAAGIGAAEQYVTIYSGMETEPFVNPPVPRQQVRRDLGFSDEDIVIGTIARLFDLKGHDDLLDVAGHLCRQFPTIRFLWVGDGTLRRRLVDRMHQMGLRKHFVLTGMVPPSRVPELTGAMDILVHPSRREGLARALPQAALAGIPSIAYDVDGNREAVIDGKTGLIIPPFDSGQLGHAISMLVEKPALRQQMGQAGREFALGRFDAAVMVEALERLYHEILEARGHALDSCDRSASG
ncbi:MAG: glycosyltransferase family 4 protein [Tepidisphaeraceae bacterium]|jgi:glycosyltransferase involved in cell wall biosynthesis